MATRAGISVEDFERALDEFFDEMLIFAMATRRVDELENAQVIEHHDRYELRISAPEVDPRLVEVEVTGQRLSVSAPAGPEGKFESCAPSHSDRKRDHRGSMVNRTLVIIVPKQKPKRIKVRD